MGGGRSGQGWCLGGCEAHHSTRPARQQLPASCTGRPTATPRRGPRIRQHALGAPCSCEAQRAPTRLEHGEVDLLKAEEPRHLNKLAKQPVLQALVLGEEVAGAARRVDVHHALGPRTADARAASLAVLYMRRASMQQHAGGRGAGWGFGTQGQATCAAQTAKTARPGREPSSESSGCSEQYAGQRRMLSPAWRLMQWHHCRRWWQQQRRAPPARGTVAAAAGASAAPAVAAPAAAACCSPIGCPPQPLPVARAARCTKAASCSTLLLGHAARQRRELHAAFRRPDRALWPCAAFGIGEGGQLCTTEAEGRLQASRGGKR